MKMKEMKIEKIEKTRKEYRFYVCGSPILPQSKAQVFTPRVAGRSYACAKHTRKQIYFAMKQKGHVGYFALKAKIDSTSNQDLFDFGL